MLSIIIFLVILAGLAKSIQDTLAHHWTGSIFERWSKLPTWFGRFVAAWAGPGSWENKNFPENRILRVLTRTVLVPFMDAWHAFGWVKYTSYQLAIALLLPTGDHAHPWLLILLYVAFFKLIQGAAFEVPYNLLGSPGLYRTLYADAPRWVSIATVAPVFIFLVILAETGVPVEVVTGLGLFMIGWVVWATLKTWNQ